MSKIQHPRQTSPARQQLHNFGRAGGRATSNIQKSFTLIEVLVVIGVMLILFVTTVVGLRLFQKKSDLDINAQGIISILRVAQSKTLASEEESQYGVYFDDTTTPNQYILFKGDSYINRDNSYDKVYKFPDSVEISQINLGEGKETVFSRLEGNALPAGDFTIRLIENPPETKKIYIENSGLITLTSSSIIAEGRTADSRHVHFDYNQNAQNALTLRLIFPDYLSDNYDIPFQDYLDAAKTEFDWEGTVLVGPEGNKTEQKLRIHTHSLTSFDAQFCVHRDRRYNDKALNITLDTENLINFTAVGEESKGSSFWVAEPQRQ